MRKIMRKIGRLDHNARLAICWIFICVVGRLIPHPANFTPLTNLCLFAGSKLSKRLAFLVILVALLVSDITLAYWQGHQVLSSWSIFTYSGFAATVCLGTKIPNGSKLTTLAYVFASSLGFWIWTNFGTWLCSGMYALTPWGLSNCYLAALPFLRNALCGDLVWFGVVFFGFARLKNLAMLRV